MGRTRKLLPKEREIHKVLYGREMRSRSQGRPRVLRVADVRQDAASPEVRDWQASTGIAVGERLWWRYRLGFRP